MPKAQAIIAFYNRPVGRVSRQDAGARLTSQFFFNGDYGAMRIEATPDSLTLQFYTRRHVLVDTYVLRQALSPAPKLYPVRPNPFQDATTIDLSLPRPATVELRVLNSLGQEVTRLHQGPLAGGWHRFVWARRALPPGLYYVQLLGSDFTQVARAVAL